MFGRRSDGVPVKGLDIIEKAGPHFMLERNDAMNMIFHDLRCEKLDEWLCKKREQGENYNYMHIVIASLVRLLAIRPDLNRFVVRGKVYQRKGIFISITVKKSLHDSAGTSAVKMEFSGKETLQEVVDIVNNTIKIATQEGENTSTLKKAKSFSHMPNFLIRWFLGFARFLDKRGALPKSLIKADPFHTSIYVTNLKSLKTDAILHHLFNFGTTGMFVSMGKEKLCPVVEHGKLAVGKIMKLGITMDERICDGFYFARSLRVWNDIMTNPSVLEKPFTLQDIINK